MSVLDMELKVLQFARQGVLLHDGKAAAGVVTGPARHPRRSITYSARVKVELTVSGAKSVKLTYLARVNAAHLWLELEILTTQSD